jgi:hypothetical protein
MWKRPASVVCGCLAVLPLIGCAGSVATPQQAAMARTEAAFDVLLPNAAHLSFRFCGAGGGFGAAAG